jgi:catechol 2,3-dioxygenase-like lactoylglutathione lyase family enzyme
MKRFHVHLGVENLDRSIGFYSTLFGAGPSVRKDDYAKWMLDDPRINFAISQRGSAAGVNHLGLQVESAAELAAVRAQFEAADATTALAEPGASCCYAKSDKHWVTDPQGIAWEAFHTLAAIPFFAGEKAEAAMPGACCSPVAAQPAAASARCVAAAANADGSCCAPVASKASATCCD